MKKKFLFLFILSLFLIPIVKAEEITIFKINTELQDGEVLYGDNYAFSANTEEYQKYFVNSTLCPESEGGFDYEKDCYDSSTGKFPELKPGKYKVGFRVTVTPGNSIGSNYKWLVNNEEIDPVQCGTNSEDSIGCEKFFTVELKDWEYMIASVKIDNVTTIFKDGDVPKFTGTISEEDKKYYNVIEGWCTSKDAIFDEKGGSCTLSNGTKIGAGIDKFEAGKTYYYLINFESKKESYALATQSPIINGKEYDINSDISGIGDYSFGQWLPFSIEIAEEVKLVNNESEEVKAAEEVVNDALTAIVENKEVKGITKEVVQKIKDAISDGKTITSEVTSEPKKEDEVKDEVKNGVEKTKEENQKILGFFDINLVIKADNTILGNITELKKTIPIRFNTKELIERLPKVLNGKKRIFSILRFHDEAVDILPATLNDDNSLSSETDKFSDYVVIYEDIDDEAATTNPKTGDNVTIYIFMLGLSVIGFVGTKLYKNIAKIIFKS